MTGGAQKPETSRYAPEAIYNKYKEKGVSLMDIKNEHFRENDRV